MAPYTLPPKAVWFITGCSSGMGATLVTYLSTHTDALIVATARNPTTLSSLPSTPNILKLALDVTSETSIRSAITTTLAHWHRIDILVNNAGYGLMADTETVPPSISRPLMETNFWGPVLLTQLILPIFREQNALSGTIGGLVLQVSSMGGRMAFAGNAFYHASKFALEGFTEAVAKEMHPDWNIHFLLLEPGGVKTRFAETSTKDDAAAGDEGWLDAYLGPSLGTNQLLAYKQDKEATKGWAEPGKVVEAIYGVVSGGEVPLRLALGSDAWNMVKMGYEEGLKGLERWKEVGLGTSGGEQLESIGFLKK
ncbi:short-chain dehydrogenase [Amniculicola lignicola CBS 123094]|uniref:Short-chain dehydrogenase n=1 Tax=Amniculicola lignicola CBS 123094 TaxID=1392246 RepID=A0A6A5W4J0_9PLEO|nr:short-chain dehydrogenase [Amniculicola lignicola CBS 123094]